MRRLTIDASRKIDGPRLLLAVDADEALTSNFLDSPEWNTVLSSPPGTVIGIQRANICPDLRTYWKTETYHKIGFVDDGSLYEGRKIHEPRIPAPDNAPLVLLNDIRLMHYVATDPDRLQSKHRWYQCWERVNQPHRRSIDIYRQYHYIDVIPSQNIVPLPEQWMLGYRSAGIDMTSILREPLYQTDAGVLSLIAEHGPAKFRREGIWDKGLSELIRKKSRSQDGQADLKDPRSAIDKVIHRWLEKTQPHYSIFHRDYSLLSRLYARTVEKVLGLFGW